ncbi:MAG: DUF2062 domain-containing protein [Acidobacteriota bacterium]
MIRLTRAVLRRWLEALLHIHDTPARTAGAFAIGVAYGFSPLLGLHTLLAVITAFVLNLNRVAVVAGVYSNLPWFMAPYYTVTTMAAAWVLGVELPPHFAHQLAGLFDRSFASREFWHRLWTLLGPLVWPYALGSTLGALILAGISYNLARPAIIAGRKHLHLRHDTPEEVR